MTKEIQFEVKLKYGRGRRQCVICWTVSMYTALYPIIHNLGSFVNGNDKNMIWYSMLNKMVRRYPQVAAGAPPTPNAPSNNHVVIAPPSRGTNDYISFIIDHIDYDE